jgi:hypothetical protein
MIHVIEKAECFEQRWEFEFTESGFKHLDSCGFVMAVDSGEPLNPILEWHLSGLVCISAFLI